MAKQKNARELVWAKKDGYEKRQFTRQQLDAMGTDTPNGDSYDGWTIVEAAKKPDEVKTAKEKAAEAKALKEKEESDKKAADDLAAKEEEERLAAEEEANKQKEQQ